MILCWNIFGNIFFRLPSPVVVLFLMRTEDHLGYPLYIIVVDAVGHSATKTASYITQQPFSMMHLAG